MKRLNIFSILTLALALLITQGSLIRRTKSVNDWKNLAHKCSESLQEATRVLNKQNDVMELIIKERDNFHREREAFYERKPRAMTNGYVMVTIRNMDDWPTEPVYINSNGTPILTATGFDWEIEVHP